MPEENDGPDYHDDHAEIDGKIASCGDPLIDDLCRFFGIPPEESDFFESEDFADDF